MDWHFSGRVVRGVGGVLSLLSLTSFVACMPVEATVAPVAESDGVLSDSGDPAGRGATEGALHAATFTLEGRCAGVVVKDRVHLVTAAHCIEPGEREVSVEFIDGTEATAQVSVVDRTADVAVLTLADQAPVRGLEVSDELAPAGTPALFAGRADRGTTLQDISVERLAPCPSLPGVPAALFTSVEAIPGDSGAPIVDEDFQVIGLIHGGARCSIAAPTDGVPQLLATLEEAPPAGSGEARLEKAGTRRSPAARRGPAKR